MSHPPHHPSPLCRRALLSVSDKTGLIDIALALAANHWEILSTGGTAKYLREAGISIREVAEVTGFPEILGGRVKTLHPHIHGALLAKREDPEHQAQMKEFGIGLIDLLVVNLYPFVQTIAKPNVDFAEAIENIDIGGPAMIRAAAKNHNHLAVVVNPSDYSVVIYALQNGGFPDLSMRKRLAQRAFSHTATYDAAIASYLQGIVETLGASEAAPDKVANHLPEVINVSLQKAQMMRYGENAHQSAALYVPTGKTPSGFANAQVLQGKEMSYNNYNDADSAVRQVLEFAEPACTIVKHANPCGVALSDNAIHAYKKAFACDPTSAFGGIIAFNRTVDENLAGALSEQFAEVIIAPDYTAEALLLFQKKANLRVVRLPLLAHAGKVVTDGDLEPVLDIRSILGGVLVQTPDQKILDSELKVVSAKKPTDKDLAELVFAFTVAKHVKSNAIVFTRDRQTLGIGAGQMSRVDSTRIAAFKAKDRGFDLLGSVAASDAFFPFRDGLDELAKAGAQAIIQPGGSIRDSEVISAADEHGLIMVFTGTRHFRH